MSIDEFSPAPVQVVDGIGPYGIPHAYAGAAELAVTLSLAGERTVLTVLQYSCDPVTSDTAGSLYLEAQVASDFAWASMIVERATRMEQGYDGAASREKAVQVQLDRIVMAQQDTQRLAKNALRLAPEEPEVRVFDKTVAERSGRTLAWAEDGMGLEPGPKSSEIAKAQGFAEEVAQIKEEFGNVDGAITEARAARDKSELWAEEDEDTEVDPGQYSALHHAAKSALAATAAGVAQTGAETAKGGAEAAQAGAELAAAAQDIFESTAAGLASTTEGGLFWVPSAGALDLYRHDAGPLAFDMDVSVATSPRIEQFETITPTGLALAGGTVREKGETVTPELSWVQTKSSVYAAVSAQSVDDGGGPESVGTGDTSWEGDDVTEDTTFTVEITDALARTSEASITLDFRNRLFWGASANATLTSAQIIALAGAGLSNVLARAMSIAASGGAPYVYYAWPLVYGDPSSVKVGGFALDGAGYTLATVSVSTAAGHVEDYRVLRLAQQQSGTVLLEVS
ncbi:hypothetical protein [Pseudooceanicola algae]|uniref:Uncharacterized protein n=1 Tax=Pseudooceanicola algae TaxID=1537215 RepID=A0A418SK70_9RHOB|nr:hypothetical protein [Pseudooceanicola algae]QPM89161.1 hypothetical protein PSAL_003720 [Pseudooceanicola algae]